MAFNYFCDSLLFDKIYNNFQHILTV